MPLYFFMIRILFCAIQSSGSLAAIVFIRPSCIQIIPAKRFGCSYKKSFRLTSVRSAAVILVFIGNIEFSVSHLLGFGELS